MRTNNGYNCNPLEFGICKASMATPMCLIFSPRCPPALHVPLPSSTLSRKLARRSLFATIGRCPPALHVPLPSSTLSRKLARRSLFATIGSTRAIINKRFSVKYSALRGGTQGTGDTVYQGIYGPWTIDSTDNREVILYRAGLVTTAASFVVAASTAFLPGDFFIKSLLQQNLDILYALGVGGLGLSLVLIHIYVTPIKRTLQILWAVGMLGSLSTYLNLAQPAGEGLAQYVIENPVAIWFVGPLFAALTGLVFKEGLCYGKLEAAALTLVIPTLLLGHLTGFMDDQLKLGLLGLWMVLFTVFAARKFTQPIKDDIGDKSIFMFNALPEEQKKALLLKREEEIGQSITKD